MAPLEVRDHPSLLHASARDYCAIASNHCWILGAGASYDCIKPGRTATPMIRDLLIPDDCSGEIAEATGILAAQWHALPKDFLIHPSANLETFLTAVRRAAEIGKPSVQAVAMRLLMNLTTVIANNIRFGQMEAFLAHDGTRGFIFCAENYLVLASLCGHNPDMSVITLNYDWLLDKAFEFIISDPPIPWQYHRWHDLIRETQKSVLGHPFPTHPLAQMMDNAGRKIAESYGYLPEPPDSSSGDQLYSGDEVRKPKGSGVFLKLHGSLDMYECLNHFCDRYRVPVTLRAPKWKLTENHLGVFAPPKCICGRDIIEMLLPLTHNKFGGPTPFYRKLWRQAARALQRANGWTFVGYSAPLYDEDVMRLLRTAIRSQPQSDVSERSVWVLSPDAKSVAERLSRILEYPVNFVEETFSKFADTILARSGKDRPGIA